MFRLPLQLLLADLSVLPVQPVRQAQPVQQASAPLAQLVRLDLLALLPVQQEQRAQQALAQLAQLELPERLVLKERQSMLLEQLLTLDLYLQQAQLMMRTLLPQMAIYIFGMALLGQA
jgi:hypothetical protein